METVAEAIAAGRTHLAVDCRGCRVLSYLPWGLLQGIDSETRIHDIADRLVCRKCGARPDREKVRSGHPTEGVAFPKNLYGSSQGAKDRA